MAAAPTVHRRSIHPSTAIAVAEAYLVGGLSRLAALAGVELRTPDRRDAGDR
jgi:hypothetical protein